MFTSQAGNEGQASTSPAAVGVRAGRPRVSYATGSFSDALDDFSVPWHTEDGKRHVAKSTACNESSVKPACSITTCYDSRHVAASGHVSGHSCGIARARARVCKWYTNTHTNTHAQTHSPRHNGKHNCNTTGYEPCVRIGVSVSCECKQQHYGSVRNNRV